MKIVFIVDGGLKIGLGHVYQSITFAKVLTDIAEINFVTKSDDTVVKKISDAGFPTLKFSDDIEILEFLEQNKPEIVIIDKIDVSESIAKAIREEGKMKLVIFTNLTDANRYADIAVTADIGSNFENIRFMNQDTKTLYVYGPKYWILRKEFHDFHKRKKPIPEIIKRILMIFGGSDPSNLTTLVINELLKMPNHPKIDVILGASFGNTDSLNQILMRNENADKQIMVYRDVSNVAELMYQADAVIASPGLSAFEALYVGTPILLIPQDLLQFETYQGYFKIISKEDIASLLVDCILKMDFTFPNQDDIIRMDIAGGTEELIQLIIGDKK